jgi:hypothetical protein
MPTDSPLREQLARSLGWSEAHVSFDTAVADFPVALRGVRPDGIRHSAWELVEHIRIAQRDILDFCVAEEYRDLRWPDDYWPASAAPESDREWEQSIAAVVSDRDDLIGLARSSRIDLGAVPPHGTDQTYVRAFLLVVDHTAYHVGQLVLVRQALDSWPAS